jgi:peptide-methionine (S)-S-oxide reductase
VSRRIIHTLLAYTGTMAVLSSASLPARAGGVPKIKATTDTIVVAGGCYWGIEAIFRHTKGVTSAVSGYAGGTKANPTSEEVSTGKTGHAEAVEVVYDPSKVSLDQLLEVFFASHSPTELNRQGADVGSHYRSGVFYRTSAQKEAIAAHIKKLADAKRYKDPIVTEVAQLTKFYPATPDMQNYVALHPKDSYVVKNDAPKFARFKKNFPQLYRD